MSLVAAPQTPLERFNGQTFRVLLDCLARPGKIGQLPSPPFTSVPSPADTTPSNVTAIAACMSLLDQTVSFVHAVDKSWLPATHPLSRWIMVRSNARLVTPAMADFALLHDFASIALLPQLPEGTLLYPEHSCTVFLCVPAIVAGGKTLRLTGPGIATVVTVGLPDAASNDLAGLMARRGLFPLGVDLFLIDRQGFCLGLPRTTEISLC
ncbi:phosphonate C-P lyase system protein PhnH [Chloroflexus sp. MS-G]|jgi:alpha-D-ribose 1-methylphosphonate 5-triphosphate synthase subunit PhnH|uniref:phosphonate C-P lyase system protein PhnH n=1 Tax=Chloroflexus sp. MS-G TaxID=1521187 RepID=UPI0004DF07D1|nr:phosphonate C-P lyase system protein PhnH [Chloroflexus sp. MS-G]